MFDFLPLLTIACIYLIVKDMIVISEKYEKVKIQVIKRLINNPVESFVL
jgi:hypothetical protein